MPGSFSAKGRQYTGTGTGTWLVLVVNCRFVLLPCAIEPAGPGTLAGKLHPYACNRPSSLRTWALTCRYCSRLSVARRAASFSDDLVSTDSKCTLYSMVSLLVSNHYSLIQHYILLHNKLNMKIQTLHIISIKFCRKLFVKLFIMITRSWPCPQSHAKHTTLSLFL